MPRKAKTTKNSQTKAEKSSDLIDLNNILVNDLSDEEYKIDKGELSLDIFEDEKCLYIESPVSGVEADDLDIKIEEDKIVIKGIRRISKDYKSRNYIYRECFYGSFSRSVLLPCEIIPEKTIAKINNGLLRITLLKK